MINAEQNLWRAVIDRTVRDACGAKVTGSPSYDACMRDQARAWLLGCGPDYVTVCELAGLDPLALHDALRELAGDGWQLPGPEGAGMGRADTDGRDEPAFAELHQGYGLPRQVELAYYSEAALEGLDHAGNAEVIPAAWRWEKRGGR